MPNLTAERLIRLLRLADKPVPGDRVRITTNAKNKAIHGCTGTVEVITNVIVMLDPDETHTEPCSVFLTPQSLEILD